jgi:hypothetical protein
MRALAERLAAGALAEAKEQLIAIRYFDRLLEAGEPREGAAREGHL